MSISFDVNIAEILTIGAGGVSFLLTIRGYLSKLDVRMKNVEELSKTHVEKIDELGKLLVAQARTEERISNLRRELDDMKRGRGFIVDPPPFGSAFAKS